MEVTKEMTIQDKANKAAAYRYLLLDHPSDDNQLLEHWQKIYAEGYMQGISELWQEVDINNIPDGVVIAKMKNYPDILCGFLIHVSGKVTVRGIEVTHYIEIETLLNILKETK